MIFSAAQVVGKTLNAKRTVQAFTQPDGKTVARTFRAGQPVGVVYSWVETPSGLFWMFQPGISSQPYFVKHQTGTFEVVGGKAILDKIREEEEKEKREQKGVVQYNVDKYLPWIIGGGVLVYALPTILAATSSKKINGSKMKAKNNLLPLAIAAGALALYFMRKKKRVALPPVIGPGTGEFLSNTATLEQSNSQDTQRVDWPQNIPAQTSEFDLYPNFVGPFEIEYQNRPAFVNGTSKKLGNIA